MDLKTPSEMNFTSNMEVNWKNWKQRLSFYLLATDRTSKSDETKIAILLTLIGEDGLNVYNTLKETEIHEKDKLSFDKVIKAFNNYCCGKKNIVYERHVFLKCKRQEGQSIENYGTNLKLKAASCEYQ